jgi:hypothetical protein
MFFFFWGRPQTDSPTYTSHIAGVTDASHLTQIICSDGGFLTFAQARLEP